MSDLAGKVPASVNWCLPQGQTWDDTILWESDGVPVDLTGWAVRMSLRTTPEAASATLALSTATGTMTTTSAGIIGLAYPAISSSAITAANYVYDLEVENPSGNVRRLMEGRALVSREVTR
jgi:hypothetical protein